MSKKNDKKEKNPLVSQVKEAYSEDKYNDGILEQYKLYAQILDEHHNRFMNTIKFFISIQFIFLSGFLVIIKNEVEIGTFGTVMLTASALFVCIVWFMISKSHYKLTSAKHETLEEMEAYLPLKPFSYEWHEKLKSGNTYISIRTVLFALPLVMAIIYISLGVVAIYF